MDLGCRQGPGNKTSPRLLFSPYPEPTVNSAQSPHGAFSRSIGPPHKGLTVSLCLKWEKFMENQQNNAFSQILQGLTREGADYLDQTRKSPPSRLVGRNASGSLVVSYPSRKMGFAIVCESNLERFAAIEFELSESVPEYYPQPPLQYISKPNKLGRLQTCPYTPDFLIVKNGVVVAVQVKSSDAASKLAKEKPWEWIQQENEFINRPIRSYFANMGISHVVLIPEQQGNIKLANLVVLDAAMRVPWELNNDEIAAIHKILKNRPCLSIKEAAEHLGRRDVTGITQLIACNIVSCDIDNELLDNPDSAHISLEPSLIKLRASSDSNGGTGLFGDLSVDLLTKSLLRLERLKNIGTYEKTRNDYRLLKRLDEGRKKGVSDLVALAPNNKSRGNRLLKIHPSVFDFAKQYISTQYLTVKGCRDCQHYYKYKVSALEAHPNHPPISKVTFFKYLLELNPIEVARAQKGRRAANAIRPASPIDSRYIRSSIPFMESSMDHYTTDIFTEILGYGDIKIEKRLYLSAMTDLASGAILAYYLSIKSPSRATIGVLIRRCVKSWGCLPRSIRVDRGAEFKSVYIDALLAHLEIVKVLSPASDPRFGSEIERFFLEVKNNWLSGRPGFVSGIQDRRSIDRKLSPEATASLSPIDLLREIECFVKLRNERPHGVRSKSPNTLIAESQKIFSFARIPVVFDSNFLADTAVDLRKLSICRKNGIKVNGMHYWHPDMASRQFSSADVRLDPENPFLIYFCLKDRWLEAISSGYQHFESLPTEAEKMAQALWLHQGESIRKAMVEEAHLKIASAQRTFDRERDEEKPITKKPSRDDAPPSTPLNSSVIDIDINDW